MSRLRAGLRFVFERLEALLGLAFPPAWNPLYHLGGARLLLLLDRRGQRHLSLRLLRHRRHRSLWLGRGPDPRPVVRGRRDAQPAPLRLGCHGGRHGGPSRARGLARPLPRAALVHLGDRGADPLARDRRRDHRLLAGLGQARPVRRGRDHRVARPARDLRPVDRAQLPGTGQPERPLLHPAGVHAHRDPADPAAGALDSPAAGQPPRDQPGARPGARHVLRDAGPVAGQAGGQPRAGGPGDRAGGGRPRLVLSRPLSLARELARAPRAGAWSARSP